MKIAIALEENSYNSLADRRFGRAAYFILINPETDNYEIIENEAKDEATGAGLKAVKTLINLGVNEIIAGEIGPKAAVLINEFEIPVYKMGELTKVSEILKNYKENKLEKKSEDSCQSSLFLFLLHKTLQTNIRWIETYTT